MLSLKLFWVFFLLFCVSPMNCSPTSFCFFLPKLCNSDSYQLHYCHLTRVKWQLDVRSTTAIYLSVFQCSGCSCWFTPATLELQSLNICSSTCRFYWLSSSLQWAPGHKQLDWATLLYSSVWCGVRMDQGSHTLSWRSRRGDRGVYPLDLSWEDAAGSFTIKTKYQVSSSDILNTSPYIKTPLDMTPELSSSIYRYQGSSQEVWIGWWRFWCSIRLMFLHPSNIHPIPLRYAIGAGSYI